MADASPIRVRMGLHTGEAEPRDGSYFGTAVNRAARLMAAGQGGQVLCSAVTAGLVEGDATLMDLGEHRLQVFTRKGEAERFLTGIEADKLKGSYIDPNAGRVTFKNCAVDWLEAQTFDPSTRETTALRLKNHVYPVLGAKELRKVEQRKVIPGPMSG